MKRICTIFFLFGLLGCQSKSELQKIDLIVEESVTERFDNYDKSLWNRLEDRFYQGIDEPEWEVKEKRKLLSDFMKRHHSEGYSDNFFLNNGDNNLLNDLSEIGFKKGDEAAHEFLYSIIARNVKSSNYSGDLLKDAPMIASYTMVNPDSISLSFTQMDFELYKYFDEKDLERKGLYKLIVIFYFSEMVNFNN